jgi:transcriptional regulator with XRE-family HTH domain
MAGSGESDETLSKKVGVSRVQMTRLRNGTNKPSRRTALELEKVTGIPAAKFFFGGEAAA